MLAVLYDRCADSANYARTIIAPVRSSQRGCHVSRPAIDLCSPATTASCCSHVSWSRDKCHCLQREWERHNQTPLPARCDSYSLVFLPSKCAGVLQLSVASCVRSADGWRRCPDIRTIWTIQSYTRPHNCPADPFRWCIGQAVSPIWLHTPAEVRYK